MQSVLRCAVLLLACLLALLPRANAADPQSYDVKLDSTGSDALDATLKATSQLQALRSSAPVGPFGLIARARSDINRLQTVLQSFGYYQGAVTITIDTLPLNAPDLSDKLIAMPNGSEAHCRISFVLGPIYHLGRIDIEGTVPDDARSKLALATGAPAVAAEVLAGGARMLTQLENQGYAFAKVDPPIAYEDPQQKVLNLSFRVVTGPRVRVGEIHITGLTRVHESLVRRRLLLHTGEPYDASKVEAARKDLLDLGVFATVSVRLGTAPDAEGRVPVTFRVRERPRHAVTLNAAYSSDLGASGGVSWSDRNVFGNAEQLTLSATVINVGGSASTSLGYDTSARYTIPDFGHRDQSLQFTVGALKQFLDAYDQTAQTAGVSLSRKLSSLWRATVGVTLMHETIAQQDLTTCIDNPPGEGNPPCEKVSNDYTLVSVPLGVTYDTTNLASPLDDPTHGFRASMSVSPTFSFATGTTATSAAAAAAATGNQTFLITQASIASYIDLSRLFGADAGRSVLALRALGGFAQGASTIELPPDQRFYAGGSGTVRGYRYQSVGPQFKDGNPIGGTAMTAASAEYRQRFLTNFGAAVFVDVGQVSDSLDPTSGIYRVGIGTGVRYYTPIGPVRFDVAFPTKRAANDDHFEIYIGLGQAF